MISLWENQGNEYDDDEDYDEEDYGEEEDDAGGDFFPFPSENGEEEEEEEGDGDSGWPSSPHKPPRFLLCIARFAVRQEGRY